MKKYAFEYIMEVRDYECDLQGIVNNANYQHYLEHTRHKFLEAHNVSFADLHNRGIDAVVARVSIDYKNSLKPGDKFASRLNLVKDGIKYTFFQDIYRLPDEKVCIKARIDSVTIINGRLGICQELEDLVEKIAAETAE
ncbi:MAG: acyl-CoA thioesterase [Paludibacteraceae bacterium]|jgi:acyl-CoA thioester hydrolase|nr:acyl-CoA thioesterase [Paludibacteraceae bacterium]MBR6077959.1 acyl-CoA thioesterase [Paludibacteraceae bacterium]